MPLALRPVPSRGWVAAALSAARTSPCEFSPTSGPRLTLSVQDNGGGGAPLSLLCLLPNLS